MPQIFITYVLAPGDQLVPKATLILKKDEKGQLEACPNCNHRGTLYPRNCKVYCSNCKRYIYDCSD